MRWTDLPPACRTYLVAVYCCAVPLAFLCFMGPGSYSASWLLLTAASFFVASINVNLPQIPSVLISMGDVFTVLALINFGPGPALVTYWANVLATAVAGYAKRHGHQFFSQIRFHRLFFNLSCCALSTYGMSVAHNVVLGASGAQPSAFAFSLIGVAAAWFFINTGTLSVAVSLSTHKSVFLIWREGLSLYLANFFGSAAAAGLVSLFYNRTEFSIFLLSIPIAVILYQMHIFYVQKYEQARGHIQELNTLYLQTIEAMANAVDAKDRYTHGHIRRVQAYATELARLMGITDEKELMGLRAGALLHDIGKIAIPEYILNKPATLTESEYDKMKLHPVVGANMLKHIDFPYPVVPVVRSHHERFDGNGYPDRLAGENIPLNARILSLVDCYDALTTNRPYRSPMPRAEIIDFFQREASLAYDPDVVTVFVRNLSLIERAGREVEISEEDIWGIRDGLRKEAPVLRPLEKVQPIIAYGKALRGASPMQQHLYAIFQFAHADIQGLQPQDVLLFMGGKLSELLVFDAAVFYIANLQNGTVVAEHVVGTEAAAVRSLVLPLEQKLSGWAAANNQSLCNLPPFPDFANLSGDRPSFEMSSIAAMNRNGSVLGAISVYRKDRVKFSEEEFRRLELVAGQTSLCLSRCSPAQQEGGFSDALTGLPTTYQLYLMFDQVTADAQRFDYPLALLSIRMDDAKTRRRWSRTASNDAIRTVAHHMAKELRETDLLVRYAHDEFVAIVPRMDRDEAEGLKSRLQNDLDHFHFQNRIGSQAPLPVSIGIAMFPQDGTSLDSLVTSAEWRLQEDGELRAVVRRIQPS